MSAIRTVVLGLAVLAAAAGLVKAGHTWGSSATTAVWQEREATRQREAREALQAEVQRGQAFVADAINEQLDQRDRYDRLEQTYTALQKAAPLVVARSAPAAVADVAGADGPAVAQGGPACEEGAGRQLAEPDSAAVDLRLTLAAVRMWNGALAGEDAPAGACGAAATAAEAAAACAQDSGLTPDDAWANHAHNARACAEDRANHQRLIDFIQRKDQ